MMPSEHISAIIFALLVIAFGWRYFGRGLRADGFHPATRRLLLSTGTAIIVLSLLYYLGAL